MNGFHKKLESACEWAKKTTETGIGGEPWLVFKLPSTHLAKLRWGFEYACCPLSHRDRYEYEGGNFNIQGG